MSNRSEAMTSIEKWRILYARRKEVKVEWKIKLTARRFIHDNLEVLSALLNLVETSQMLAKFTSSFVFDFSRCYRKTAIFSKQQQLTDVLKQALGIRKN